MTCDGAKKSISVELTILDKDATSWNVVDRAPGWRE
jgi:hypothetical protein